MVEGIKDVPRKIVDALAEEALRIAEEGLRLGAPKTTGASPAKQASAPSQKRLPGSEAPHNEATPPQATPGSGGQSDEG